MRRSLIAAWMLLALAGCGARRTVSTGHIGAEATRVVRLQRADSLVAVTVARLDSPEITIEWPDSPRRRITVRARRVTLGRRAESQTVTDSVAAAETRTRGERRIAERRTGHLGPWIVAAGAAVLLMMMIVNIRRL